MQSASRTCDSLLDFTREDFDPEFARGDRRYYRSLMLTVYDEAENLVERVTNIDKTTLYHYRHKFPVTILRDIADYLNRDNGRLSSADFLLAMLRTVPEVNEHIGDVAILVRLHGKGCKWEIVSSSGKTIVGNMLVKDALLVYPFSVLCLEDNNVYEVVPSHVL